MTAHNLLLHERSRQEQAKQLRFRKLFHIGRPVTVLSVALLAATAVMGSTINTMRYLDSISAALPVPTTHRVTGRRSVNTQTLALGSSVSSDSAGRVLGATVIAPAPSTEAQINVAAMTSTIASLVNNLVNQYLSQGLLTGPAGPPGPSELTPGFSGPNGMVQNDNGQTTSVIGGAPIVSYIPASQGNGNYTGGSLAGFTNLSGQNLTANTENVTGNLAVQGSSSFGSATFSGSASVAGTFSAATSTFSTLTVSGPATFTGSTTIAGLTVTGFNPGLTLGSVAFQGATGLSQDNSNYFYNPTTHSLGLGTSSPTSTLFVQGSGSNNPFVIASSTGTQLLTVLPNGNVGIGTTNPVAMLDVNGTLAVTGTVTAGNVTLCSGTTATAINACIAAAPNGGTVQLVNAATISERLTISGKTGLTLECPGHTVIAASAATFDMLTIGSGSSGVTVRDCYFQGASVGTEGRAAIRVTDGPKTTVENVEISGTNDGVMISKAASDNSLVTQ